MPSAISKNKFRFSRVDTLERNEFRICPYSFAMNTDEEKYFPRQRDLAVNAVKATRRLGYAHKVPTLLIHMFGINFYQMSNRKKTPKNSCIFHESH